MSITALGLALLLPACSSGGSVVLEGDPNPNDTGGDDTGGDDTGVDDTGGDDTGEEPAPDRYSGRMVAISAWEGEDYELCRGPVDYVVDKNRFDFETPCESEWLPGMVLIEGALQGDRVSGSGTMLANLRGGPGGGQSLQDSGDLQGGLEGVHMLIEFEVEFALGGGSGGYEIPVWVQIEAEVE